MNENQSWSAGIGRWMGVQVSVHVLLMLFVAAIFCVQYQFNHLINRDMAGTAMITTLVLLGSILVHELAHIFVLFNLGGMARRIVLTPWGGNSNMYLPSEPVARLIVHLAGPFVNASVFLIAAALLTQSHQVDVVSLINPFRPHAYVLSDSVVSLIKIVAWINFQMLVVNLIPSFPFDGANIVRSLFEMFGLADSKIRSESALMVLGNGCALTIIGLSWLAYGQNPGPIEPAWFLMLAAGITLYFAGRYSFDCQTATNNEVPDRIDERDWDFEGYPHEASFFGLANADDYQDLPADDAEVLAGTDSQWMQEKQRARAADERERELREERQADVILEKLHSGGGIGSLSEDDREVLNRVSHRLRKRRENAQMQND